MTRRLLLILLALFFEQEDVGGMFLRNIGLSPNYTTQCNTENFFVRNHRRESFISYSSAPAQNIFYLLCTQTGLCQTEIPAAPYILISENENKRKIKNNKMTTGRAEFSRGKCKWKYSVLFIELSACEGERFRNVARKSKCAYEYFLHTIRLFSWKQNTKICWYVALGNKYKLTKWM
jgi:hypothetical protein